MRRSTIAAALGLLLAVQVARGAVVATLETDIAPAGGAAGDPYNPTFAAGGPSSSDLLEGLPFSEAVGNHTQENSLGLPALTNGTVETAYGSGNASSAHAAYATGGEGESVTYAFGDVYDLDSVVVFGGWNDGGRDAQGYDIYTSDDGGQTYSLLTSYSNGNGEQQGEVNTPISHRVEFVEDTLPQLASGVSHIRLDFLSVENGWTGYTEFDVFGAPTNTPGDADLDGDVDINDFFLISDNFFSAPSEFRADGDVFADNFIDEKDFRLWKSLASAEVLAEFALLGVPEPSSIVLVGISMALLTHRRSK